jgi:hypothetical protein
MSGFGPVVVGAYVGSAPPALAVTVGAAAIVAGATVALVPGATVVLTRAVAAAGATVAATEATVAAAGCAVAIAAGAAVATAETAVADTAGTVWPHALSNGSAVTANVPAPTKRMNRRLVTPAPSPLALSVGFIVVGGIKAPRFPRDNDCPVLPLFSFSCISNSPVRCATTCRPCADCARRGLSAVH